MRPSARLASLEYCHDFTATSPVPNAAQSVFEQYHIDLTNVETRPFKGAQWQYVFFIDFVGHQSDAHVEQALHDLEHVVSHMKLLGSYPKGVL